jgi:D-serine deaminase-like pyridoxal phosphate-dependent protein
LPTPILVIDAVVLRRNIRRMAEYTAQHGLKLRPHTKTHKSLRVARLQLEAGSTGLTVAKPGEACVMAAVADDILMAYPAVHPGRADELAQIARDANVHVAIDSQLPADVLSDAAGRAESTVGILVDLDVGFGRTGVQTPQDALALARIVAQRPGLRLDGIMYYPGQIKRQPKSKTDEIAAIEAKLNEAIDLFRAAGMSTEIVSGGSTPTALASHMIEGTTEIRPGTYAYHDTNCVRAGYASFDDCAARIHTTVISNARPGQIVIDAGSKTLTSDRCSPAPDSGYGHVAELPNAKITVLSEEHGQVDISACDQRPKVGERLTVIPNHICPCVNLQDQVWWQENGELESIPVDARGRVY